MKSLERRLNLWDVTTISISTMLGSGVFVLPGLAVGMTGGSAWLAYAAAALCVLPAALSKAELSTAMPRSGGTYVYIHQVFGPWIGTISGVGLWASLLLKSSFALVGFGAYLHIFGHVPIAPVALVSLVGITIINLLGIRTVSKAQISVVALSLVTLAILIIASLPTVEPDRLDPFLSRGAAGWVETVAFVFVAYAGVTKIAAIAGEVRNPDVNVPRGMLLALAIVAPIYGLVVFVLNGNIDREALSHDLKPMYTLAEHMGGPIVGGVVAVVAVVTMISMANAGLLAASRFPFAMSRDSLLPRGLGDVHPTTLIPTLSVILTAVTMAFLILFLDIERIIKLASAAKIIAFTMTNLALIVIRAADTPWYKPAYRSPLYPLTQIFGIGVGIVLLASMGYMAWVAIVGMASVGTFIYVVYGRSRTDAVGVFWRMGKRHDLLPNQEEQPQDIDNVLVEDMSAVVAVMGNEPGVEMLAKVGSALCDEKTIEIVHVTEVPNDYALDSILEEDAVLTAIRRRVMSMRELTRLNVKFDPVVCHDRIATIHNLSNRLHCEWLVLSWKDFNLYNPFGWLINHLSCDLALFRDVGIRYIRCILVYPEPGPNDALVARTAERLARSYQATVTFARFVPDSADAEVVRTEEAYLEQMRQLCPTKSESLIIRGDNELDAIVDVTQAYDLLVTGTVASSTLRNIFLANRIDRIAKHALSSVLLLKSPRDRPHWTVEPAEVPSIAQSLRQNLVVVGVDVRSKTDIFRRCAYMLSSEVRDLDGQLVIDALWEREREQNTAVGHGVAMPHATLPQLDETFLVCLVLSEPVDYQALNRKPVDVIFATMGPPSDRQRHLMLLAGISRLILSTELLPRLREATETIDVFRAVEECSEA